MNNGSTCEVLNRLWIIHHYSLPNYLGAAPAWWHDEDVGETRLLQQVIRDQQNLANRMGDLILELRGRTVAGKFPAWFTVLHDLSVEFLWSELIRYQQRTVAAIQQCVGRLPPGSLAKALAQESLGVAKAHLDSMRELLPRVTASR